MTGTGLLRSGRAPEPGAAAVPAPAPAQDSGLRPGRRGEAWWRRPRSPHGRRQSAAELEHAVLERVLALLEAARAGLSAGWVQDGWWARPAAGGGQVLVTGLVAGVSGPARADATCLVGALVQAGAAQGGGAETGRAVDAVYDALWESRNQPAGTPGPNRLRVSSPQVRQAEVQALIRWNDAPGRTAGDVLAILDRAIARVIQDLAATPVPPITGQRDPVPAP
jgi:hypothetical protein